MSAELGVSRAFTLQTATTASHCYKTYSLPKRSGGMRRIHHPSKTLKSFQRWIADKIVSRFPVHAAAMAYRKGVSIRTNADAHLKQKFLLRLDFRRFFESITAADIRKFLRANAALLPTGWANIDSELLIALCCKNGALTIGAPTSPGLSNVICFYLDEQLQTLAKAKNVIYTRYADDLHFSTDAPNVLAEIETLVQAAVEALDCPAELEINTAKTRHSSKKNRRTVTGLVLRPDGILSVGRKTRRRLRAMLHQWEQLTADEKQSASGLLSFVASIEPDIEAKISAEYGEVRLAEVKAAIMTEMFIPVG